MIPALNHRQGRCVGDVEEEAAREDDDQAEEEKREDEAEHQRDFEELKF